MSRFGHFVHGGEHRHSLYKRLDSPQSQYGRMWGRQTFFTAARFEPQTSGYISYISHTILAHTIIKYQSHLLTN
jgi:hypothetical protein